MFNPVSTYRIQFHKGFTFAHFEDIIPYLHQLGVSTIYASPIFKSVPGSTHGYDGTDPLQINPEIGTIEQLRSISAKLKSLNINWLQDIVPNHMAFHTDNSWLMDVLEKGQRSLYKDYFDTPLSSDFYQGKVMIPFLGETPDEAINNEKLKIAFAGNYISLQYAGQNYPLQLTSYHTILSVMKAPDIAARDFVQQINQVNAIEDAARFSPEMDELKAQMAALTKDAQFNQWLHACIKKVNKNAVLLRQITNQQHYRLCQWQDTDRHINYRRFFTINGLIGLNIHHTNVFANFHRLILQLIQEDIFQGLRIDHIDGLYNPTAYLNHLRKVAGPDVYIITEKILEQDEEMPAGWPVQGNTGYDFLSAINNLLTNQQSKPALSVYYQQLAGNYASMQDQAEDKKRYILYHYMAGELDNLVSFFQAANLAHQQKLSTEGIRQAIAEFLIACPVYRYYSGTLPLKGKEKTAVKIIFNHIKKMHANISTAVDALAEVFLKAGEDNEKALDFFCRCMQLTGPLMAKGVEDTLMYTNYQLIAHNEVGDNPDALGLLSEDFHRLMKKRQKHWPLGMNATSTHDTKRGEDVRARLNVITDMGNEWLQLVSTWQRQNRALKTDAAPHVNDEYLIYQTLAGVYPMPGEDDIELQQRLDQYFEKALREGKQHSGWDNPNSSYENAVKQFTAKLTQHSRPFWKSFKKFHYKLSNYGVVNSLAQVLLKFTCPGVPDVYQGCEQWDLSLVDPDNRRPVNYTSLNAALNTHASVSALWNNRFNGNIKHWLVNKLMQHRKGNPLLFAAGKYIPLQIDGFYKDNVLAFARHYKRAWYISVIPLHIATLCEEQKTEVINIDWKDTRITLPDGWPGDFTNVLTESAGKSLHINSLLNKLPVALLKLAYPANNRASGLLMHITSLPSAFGIGDLGPSARQFANLLQRSYQKYWQLLPLNPIEAKHHYSPYSSYSSMAGNTLLISPELLVQDGLLSYDDIENRKLPPQHKTDYPNAERLKQELFQLAWISFEEGKAAFLKPLFETFKQKEDGWLNDFALYLELKKQNGNKPWYQWAAAYKNRQKAALNKFSQNNYHTIEQTKWLQFIFHRQWHQLKAYCNRLDIKLFGDLPFYTSHDSVDVWAHPDIFSLKSDGSVNEVAGVPPDYFNADGQLWGMPVFNWAVLKSRGYDWWIQRICKNLELFDLLRLDHFRAFAAYWAVPAEADNAINGNWVPGPGNDFFNKIKERVGNMPFVAEDLGDIDESVSQLRNEFNLPGMNVLQFAFGGDMPHSAYLPHSHTPHNVVYTGTHDNNTILGWYRHDADKAMRRHLEKYTGIKSNEKNISWLLIRTAMNTVSNLCIIPVQDILQLNETARMNTPASLGNNWLWRADASLLKQFPEKKLRSITIMSNRY